MNAWLNYVGCGCVALSVLACGAKGSDGDDDDDTGTGATSGSGGSSGTSSGGSSSGGTPSGGTSSGGTSSGGTSGTTGGTGGGSMGMDRHTFDTDVEGWIVEYTSSGTLVAGGAAPVIAKGDVLLEHNADEGDPDPGMLEATIPYTTESQYVGIGINYTTGVDLSAAVLTAHVRVASGLGEAADLLNNPGGAKLYAKSGTIYCYAAGDFNNITMIGSWMTIQFDFTRTRPYPYEDPACAMPFDPTDVRELGIQFDTGGMTTTAQEAVVNIDTIAY